jgi:hypothetical protein
MDGGMRGTFGAVSIAAIANYLIVLSYSHGKKLKK